MVPQKLSEREVFLAAEKYSSVSGSDVVDQSDRRLASSKEPPIFFIVDVWVQKNCAPPFDDIISRNQSNVSHFEWLGS
jgi:hypothetical protein